MAEMMAKGESPEILFWVGCAGSFDQRAQKITRAFVTILDKVGINYAILGKEENVVRTATEVYEKLGVAGVDVLLDDRDERPGVKFKDTDLIGFPVRIAVGSKSLANGQIEWSFRKDRAKQLGAPDDVVQRVIDEVLAGRRSQVTGR